MSRKRRRRKVGKHISLSATDADWETVRSNANRRGLSIARYLVELVERDASEEDAGPRHECLRHECVNGGGNMYRGGGAKMYHGLGGSLSA